MLATALVVNRSDSRCGACGKGANPNDTKHTRILSWGDKGAGCDVTWTHVTSDYAGGGIEEAIQADWPHLVWFPQFDLQVAAPSGRTEEL